MKASLVPTARIERAIPVLRGHKVLLDADLAALYEVPTKVLLQVVKRNLERFPLDFMFRLSGGEFEVLRSQFGDGSIYSVERMAVAGHSWAHANEGGRPQQHGGRVRAVDNNDVAAASTSTVVSPIERTYS